MAVTKASSLDSGGNSPLPVGLATLYSGRSQHAIDKSNRIMLPSEWRIEGAPVHFFVLIVPSKEYLIVCPPKIFEDFLAELRNDTADKSLIPQIERELNDRVRQVSLDRFGRLPVPADLLVKAGIEKQGELVGRFSKFEIWPRARYQAPKIEAERNQAAAAALTRLQSL